MRLFFILILFLPLASKAETLYMEINSSHLSQVCELLDCDRDVKDGLDNLQEYIGEFLIEGKNHSHPFLAVNSKRMFSGPGWSMGGNASEAIEYCYELSEEACEVIIANGYVVSEKFYKELISKWPELNLNSNNESDENFIGEFDSWGAAIYEDRGECMAFTLQEYSRPQIEDEMIFFTLSRWDNDPDNIMYHEPSLYAPGLIKENSSATLKVDGREYEFESFDKDHTLWPKKEYLYDLITLDILLATDFSIEFINKKTNKKQEIFFSAMGAQDALSQCEDVDKFFVRMEKEFKLLEEEDEDTNNSSLASKEFDLYCDGKQNFIFFTSDENNNERSEETNDFFDEYKLYISYDSNTGKAIKVDTIKLINSESYMVRFGKHGDNQNYKEKNYYEFDKEDMTITIRDTEIDRGLDDILDYYHYTKISLKSGRVSQSISAEYEDGRSVSTNYDLKCNGGEKIVAFFNEGYVNDNITADTDRSENEFNDLIQAASGSGFFINNKGNIITNNHVVEGCSEMTMFVEGEEFPATVVSRDLMNDISLLKTNYSNNDYFNIRSNDAERAEEILAVGYGFGKQYSSDIKVTSGIVSSLAGYADNYSQFQMDAAIQSGNSGGPVLDKDGNVVGISVSKLDTLYVLKDAGSLPENVNYAIKTSTLQQFLKSNNTEFSNESGQGFLKSLFNKKKNINELIDNASVYLSCYMTYSEVEEMRNKKVLFDID